MLLRNKIVTAILSCPLTPLFKNPRNFRTLGVDRPWLVLYVERRVHDSLPVTFDCDLYFAAAYRLEPGHRRDDALRDLEGDRSCDRLAGLQRDVLIGSGIGEARDQPEAGFTDPRSMAVDEGELPDRRKHRALVHDLLHLFEDRAALFLIEFGSLPLEHLVEIRVAAIGVSPTLDRHGFEPCRRVAEGAAATHDQVLVLLLGIALEEGGAFERPQPGADAPRRLRGACGRAPLAGQLTRANGV